MIGFCSEKKGYLQKICVMNLIEMIQMWRFFLCFWRDSNRKIYVEKTSVKNLVVSIKF